MHACIQCSTVQYRKTIDQSRARKTYDFPARLFRHKIQLTFNVLKKNLFSYIQYSTVHILHLVTHTVGQSVSQSHISYQTRGRGENVGGEGNSPTRPKTHNAGPTI